MACINTKTSNCSQRDFNSKKILSYQIATAGDGVRERDNIYCFITCINNTVTTFSCAIEAISSHSCFCCLLRRKSHSCNAASFAVSAFVGFPSDDSAGVFRNHILPAFLIGWNTFAFRLFFGLLLPLLMVTFIQLGLNEADKQVHLNIDLLEYRTKYIYTKLWHDAKR